MNANDLLISLLRSKVLGTDVDKKRLTELSAQDLKELYDLGSYHDVAHIVGAALVESGVLEEKTQEKSLFSNEHRLAVFLFRRFSDELANISELFEKEQIEHIALKGSVLRYYYPEPWMRTSCDIDVLVKKEELMRAKDLLVNSLGYTYVSKTGHDISLNSPTGVHIELHFALVEDTILKESHEILFSVWERAELIENKKYSYILPDDFFYFYHVVHMAKHFLSGGCGIRSFLDLWILENKISYDREKRERLISSAGFSEFEAGASKLASVWFGNREHDEFTLLIEKIVFSGGTFGTVENGVNFDVVKRKSKLKYLISRIFPSYKTMENMYPMLEKRKFLLPFYHVKRWCRVIFKGGAKRARVQIMKCKNLGREELDEAAKALNYLGLNKTK